MWLALFGLGAALLPRLRLPTPLAALPCPPPPEARYALYFLVAALLRLAICDARLRALERRARRAERRALGLARPGLAEVGAGVGKGVAEVVLGDLMGALLAGATLLLRFAASAPAPPQPAAARAAERRRAARRERGRALGCIVGVGAICAGAAWLPLLWPRALPLLDAAARWAFR